MFTKREVLHQSRLNGGLEMKNVLLKAQSILSSTFLKQFMNPNENELLKYFCAIRVNPLLDIRELTSKVSYVNPEYFTGPITIIRKMKHFRTFPIFNSNNSFVTYVSTNNRDENQYKLEISMERFKF